MQLRQILRKKQWDFYSPSAKISLNEVYVCHFEGLSVQIFENSGVGFETKAQFIGVKRLAALVETLIQLAVLAVAQKGVACCGELGADLVGPAGNEFALHQGKTVLGLECFI